MMQERNQLHNNNGNIRKSIIMIKYFQLFAWFTEVIQFAINYSFSYEVFRKSNSVGISVEIMQAENDYCYVKAEFRLSTVIIKKKSLSIINLDELIGRYGPIRRVSHAKVCSRKKNPNHCSQLQKLLKDINQRLGRVSNPIKGQPKNKKPAQVIDIQRSDNYDKLQLPEFDDKFYQKMVIRSKQYKNEELKKQNSKNLQHKNGNNKFVFNLPSKFRRACQESFKNIITEGAIDTKYLRQQCFKSQIKYGQIKVYFQKIIEDKGINFVKKFQAFYNSDSFPSIKKQGILQILLSLICKAQDESQLTEYKKYDVLYKIVKYQLKKVSSIQIKDNKQSIPNRQSSKFKEKYTKEEKNLINQEGFCESVQDRKKIQQKLQIDLTKWEIKFAQAKQMIAKIKTLQADLMKFDE